MTELADVIPQSDPAPSIRRARVISVAGRNLTVDMGGGITIPSLDSCNPLPDQWVYIIGEGSSMTAIGAVAGVGRQAALTVTGSTTTTVTGILNGVSTSVSKAGAYDAAAGNILPLLWAADGSKAWALGPGGVPYVPPPAGGGGSGGGGGGVTTGTATYPATFSGRYSGGKWWSGDIYPVGASTQSSGFFYGSGRFRELQGRTITGFRANLAHSAGAAAFAIYGHTAPAPSGALSNAHAAGSYNPNGWTGLPIGLANFLISGSGTGGLSFVGSSGQLRGIPYGTLQFDWRK